MLVIELGFPAGRYHATPWDRQVNEGAVEWPPSPWRMLRALISTWHHKASGEVDEEVVASLIERLCRLPEFYLPPAAMAHTRHYMPLFRSSLDGKTTKIFDTFAALDGEKRVFVIWPDLDISKDDEKVLQILVSRIGYLGRAESWVEAKLVEDKPFDSNCRLLELEAGVPEDMEAVSTLACMSVEEYRAWREVALKEHQERRLSELKTTARERGKPEEKVKLGKKDLEEIEEKLPSDIFEAMHVDTGELKKAGWSQPPGSVWVTYVRPRNAFDVAPRSRAAVQRGDPATVARYAVASQVPPRLTEAVSLAERIHTALVSRSDGLSAFTGCDEAGRPLEGHVHAKILCESNLGLGKGRRGEITHVIVHVPTGFGPEERRVLDGLTDVWGHRGHDVQLVLLGVGMPEDFGGLEAERGRSPTLAKAKTWASRTPFVPTRHPKATRPGVPKIDESGLQIGSPEHDLRRLLALSGFPEPVAVDAISSTDLAGHETRWLAFRRDRNRGDGKRATNVGYGFRIEFAEPVMGPIALGYGAHYGLGLFHPIR